MSQNKVKQIIIVLNTGNMCNYAKQQINHAFNYLLEIMTSDLWYVPFFVQWRVQCVNSKTCMMKVSVYRLYREVFGILRRFFVSFELVFESSRIEKMLKFGSEIFLHIYCYRYRYLLLIVYNIRYSFKWLVEYIN